MCAAMVPFYGVKLAEGSSKQTFWTILTNTPELVLILPVLNNPSAPGYMSITRAKGHVFLGSLSSVNTTTSPSFKLPSDRVHLLRNCRVEMYSCCHLFQNSVARYCTCFHRFREYTSSLLVSDAVVVPPSQSSSKWFGVRGSGPWQLSDTYIGYRTTVSGTLNKTH